MIIRPTAAQAAETSRKRESLEQLAEDVLGTGVEIRAPRKWWLGTRSLSAEKAAEELRKGNPKLTVTQPNFNLKLPLKTEEDLAEVAVFHAARPASQLEHPELAEAVQSLEQAGFELVDQQHRALSLYGAYNAVTDPSHELGPLQASLGDRSLPVDQGNLAQMSAFYQSDPLGQLELDGYEFYDEKNERRFAFGSTPPRRVGANGEPWMEASGPDLKERLEAFAVLREETEDLATSQQIAGLTPDNFAHQARSILNQEKARPGLCRAARKLSTDQLLELAGELPFDQKGREDWLQLLEERPETKAAAGLGLALLRALPTEGSRDQAWAGVLARPRLTAGAEAAALLAGIQPPQDHDEVGLALAQTALDRLRDFPDTASAARALHAWQPPGGYPLVRDYLKNPTDGSDAALVKLAAAHCQNEWDHGFQQRILADLGTRSERYRIGAEMHAVVPENKAGLFQVALKASEVRTGLEAADLLLQLHGEIAPKDPWRGYDNETPFAQVALETLKRFPDTAAAAGKVADWQMDRSYETVMKLLKNPTDASPQRLRELAAGIARDPEAQARVLETLPQQARDLFQASVTLDVKDAIFRSALKHPELPDGKAALELLKGIPLEDNSYDAQSVGAAMLKVLQGFPETKAAADQVASWDSQAVYPLVKALLAEKDLKAVAAEVASDDLQGQQAILKELKLPLAEQLHSRMHTGEGQRCVVVAALRHPQMDTGVQVAAFLRDVAQMCSHTGDYRSHYDRSVLAAFTLEQLATYPDTRAAAERVAGWSPSNGFDMSCALMSNPTDSSPEAIRKLAARLDEGDVGAQLKVLQEMKADPATQKAAQVALPVFEALKHQKHAAFKAALAHPDLRTGVDAAALLRDVGRAVASSDSYYREHDRLSLGLQTLTLLQQFPDTREAAAKVAAWQAERPWAMAETLLRKPTDASPEAMRTIALQADEEDSALLLRILETDKGAPAADAGLELFARASYHATQRSILEAVIQHHDARTGPELARMLSTLKPDDPWDQTGLSQGCLTVLLRYPETRAASEAVAGWGVGMPWPLVQKMMENPTDASPATLRAIAAKVSAEDFTGQVSILDWLAKDPSTAQAAGVARSLHERLESRQSRGAVVRSALEHCELKTGAEAAGLMSQVVSALEQSQEYSARNSKDAVAPAILEQLERFPDTAPAARAVSEWQCSDLYPVVQALLKRPTDATPEALRKVALSVEASDHDGQANVLAQMEKDPATQKAAEIGKRLTSWTNWPKTVFGAVLEHPSVETGAEAARLLKDCISEESPEELGAIGLDVLRQFPDTKAAADRIESWKPTRPTALVAELLEAPTDASVENLRRVAARAQESDPLFFRGVLGGLAEPANRDLGLTVLKELQSPRAQRLWTARILQSPPVRTGSEAGVLIGNLLHDLKNQDAWWSERREDQAGLARAAGVALTGYPDTAETAKRFQSWGEGTPGDTRLELWLADIKFEKRDTYFQRAAQVVDASDDTMQKALLEELGGTTALMARAAMSEVEHWDTRFSLFKTALELGETRGTRDVERFFALAKENGGHWEDARLDELQQMYKMSFGLQGRSSDTLAEEQNRVLVGGVVVKKKD